MTLSRRAVLPMVLLSSMASAQEGPKRQLEEVIVTAQKRAESLSDVPVSVTAVSSEKRTRPVLKTCLTCPSTPQTSKWSRVV